MTIGSLAAHVSFYNDFDTYYGYGQNSGSANLCGRVYESGTPSEGLWLIDNGNDTLFESGWYLSTSESCSCSHILASDLTTTDYVVKVDNNWVGRVSTQLGYAAGTYLVDSQEFLYPDEFGSSAFAALNEFEALVCQPLDVTTTLPESPVTPPPTDTTVDTATEPVPNTPIPLETTAGPTEPVSRFFF